MIVSDKDDDKNDDKDDNKDDNKDDKDGDKDDKTDYNHSNKCQVVLKLSYPGLIVDRLKNSSSNKK